MKSRSFGSPRPKRSVLADLAGSPEQYAHSDPASSLIKPRSFFEQIATSIYEPFRLRPPYSEFVQSKLHAARRAI